MTPQSQPRKPKNSSKVNLTISAVVHGILIAVLIYFAAREGYLGKKIQTITVTKVQEKKTGTGKTQGTPQSGAAQGRNSESRATQGGGAQSRATHHGPAGCRAGGGGNAEF